MKFSEKVGELFKTQLSEWDLARINYIQLDHVKSRKIPLADFDILIQFNPERIRSSMAKVDAKSIEARPCFLCSSNRPPQQRGVAFEKGLSILVNPFPIFPRHLTIPSVKHIDQRIFPNFEKMLSLAKSIPDYIVFYNGPQCGASAPDHFHFQAGNRGFLPIENDFNSGKYTKILTERSGVEIWHWTGYLRGIVTLKGSVKENLEKVFCRFYERFSSFQPDRPEPMLNILSYFSSGEWIIHIIPRKLHRPVQFFKEGSERILLSPASVDLGGVIITPREEDYDKLKASDITDIFDQVCVSEEEMVNLFI